MYERSIGEARPLPRGAKRNYAHKMLSLAARRGSLESSFVKGTREEQRGGLFLFLSGGALNENGSRRLRSFARAASFYFVSDTCAPRASTSYLRAHKRLKNVPRDDRARVV